MNTTLTVGADAVVRRTFPNREAFRGRVLDIQPNWVRVWGPGSEPGTTFNEWFPIDAKYISVRPQ